MVEKATELSAPLNNKEQELLIYASVDIKNSRYVSSGFTPRQRVLGASHRSPRELCSDDPLCPLKMNLDPQCA